MNKEIFLPSSESPEPQLDWENRGVFTEEDIRVLLTHAGFQNLVTQALSRTNTEGHRIFGRLLGQEFGFFALGKFASEEGLHIGPLFQGKEGSIDLEMETINHLLRNPALPSFNAFHFHTHTHLWPQVNREVLGNTNILPGEEQIFSDRDLMSSFYNYTRLRNPGFIDILGTEQNGEGQLTFITFGSEHAYISYDPIAVHQSSRRFYAQGLDPLEAYRLAGINASRVMVDINSRLPFNASDIEATSKILSEER
jgi:hypothetical protein